MEKRKVVLERYEMGRVIGVGNFGKVCVGRHLQTRECVAIKIINKEKVKEESLTDQIMREILAMRMLKHPHIVEIKEVMASKTKIYIVMEYVKGGELLAKIEGEKLGEEMARKYFHQLIEAVAFCHKKGVCHRDLKLENLMLDEHGENLKVIDFGLSALTHPNRLLYTLCGAPSYVAPQVLKREGYDGVKADIWSCGVILFALLSGQLPFQDGNMMKMYGKILSGKYSFTPGFPSEAIKLVSQMLEVDPDKRISIEGIKRSAWFKKSPPPRVDTPLDIVKNVDCAALLPSSPPFFNAFELISSMASGLDLSCFFEGDCKRTIPAVFALRSSDPAAVMAEIERAGRKNKFKLRKVMEEYYKVELQAADESVCLMVEVFTVTPDVAVVEFTKSAGDSSEFVRFCEQVARPALIELIWTS